MDRNDESMSGRDYERVAQALESSGDMLHAAAKSVRSGEPMRALEKIMAAADVILRTRAAMASVRADASQAEPRIVRRLNDAETLTGVRCTAEELEEIKELHSQALSSYMRDGPSEAREMYFRAQRRAHEMALAHGLPDFAGYYGLSIDGEFVGRKEADGVAEESHDPR